MVDMIRSFFSWLARLFSRVPSKPKLTTPYPEEPGNPNATLDNANIGDVISAWFAERDVPVAYWEFWDDCDIQLTEGGTGAWIQSKKIDLNVHYANVGTLAHECSHISYGLLTAGQKLAFEGVLNQALIDDDLFAYVYNHRDRGYMRSNIIEGHADIYRYLGNKMPESLKQYYPKLF